MLLNNYLTYLKKYLNEYSSGNTYTAPLTLYDGNTGNCYILNYNSNMYGPMIARSSNAGYQNGSIYFIGNGTTTYYGPSGSTTYKGGVIIGDGDTPPALSDYKLSGNMITTFTATTSISATINNGHIEINGVYNITNTGADSFTIKECGIIIPNDSNNNYALLTRDLLTTPITIAPGDTGIMNYKITL